MVSISKHSFKHIKIILICLLAMLLPYLLIALYLAVDDHVIHGSPMYNETNSLIKSQKLIGLDFEQCYDKLYTQNKINDIYATLESENGVVYDKKENAYNYSYYAIFFAGGAVSGHDYRNRDYVIKLYFNSDIEVIFAEMIPTKS